MANLEATTPEPTRRGFLGHVAGATFAGGVIYTAVPVADPLLDLLRAYRENDVAWSALEDDAPDDHPVMVRDREILAVLRERCPAPTTAEGALEALRHALRVERNTFGHQDVINTLSGALAFFEAA